MLAGRIVVGSPTGGQPPAGAVNAEVLQQQGVPIWTTKAKTGDQSRTANTTLAADTDLQFAMAASTNYLVRGRIFFTTTAAGDFKYSLSGPSSPNRVRVVRKHIDPTALTTLVTTSEAAYTASTSVNSGTGTTGGWVEFDLVVLNGVNAGTFAFNWSQDTSDAGNTTVLAGSYLEYRVL